MENSLSINSDQPRQSEIDNTTIMMQPMTIGTMDDPTVEKVAEITLNITLTKKSEPKTSGESDDRPVTYWTGAAPVATTPLVNEFTQPKQSPDNQDAPVLEISSDYAKLTNTEIYKGSVTNLPVEVPNSDLGAELLKAGSVTPDVKTLKPTRPEDEKTSQSFMQATKGDNETPSLPEAIGEVHLNTSEQLKYGTEDLTNIKPQISPEMDIVMLKNQSNAADNQNAEQKDTNVSHVESNTDDLDKKQDKLTADGSKSQDNERIGSIMVNMDQSPAIVIINGPEKQPLNKIGPISFENHETVLTTPNAVSTSLSHQDDNVIVSHVNAEEHKAENETKTQNENIIDSLTAISHDQPTTISPASNANYEHKSGSKLKLNNDQSTDGSLNKAEDSVSSPLKVVEGIAHQNEDIVKSLTAIANNEPSNIASKNKSAGKILDDIDKKQNEQTFDENKPASESITINMDQSQTIITVNGPTDLGGQPSNNTESVPSDRHEIVENTIPQGQQDEKGAVSRNVISIEENKMQEETKIQNENIVISDDQPTTRSPAITEDSCVIDVQNFESAPDSTLTNDRPIGDLLNKTEDSVLYTPRQETLIIQPPTTDAGINSESARNLDIENKVESEIPPQNEISTAAKILETSKPTDITVTYFNEEVSEKHPLNQSTLSSENMQNSSNNAAANSTLLLDEHKPIENQLNVDNRSSDTVLGEHICNNIKVESNAAKSTDTDANLLISDESKIPTDKDANATATATAATEGVAIPINSVNNINTIDTLTNEISSIVLPTDVAASPNERPIIYPDSKDWAMSDYAESSRTEDEDYDIYDDADDNGSAVATFGMSDVHDAGHRQALSRGLRLPASAVADGTIDPTAATLVAAVRAVTRMADERGEDDTVAQLIDVSTNDKLPTNNNSGLNTAYKTTSGLEGHNLNHPANIASGSTGNLNEAIRQSKSDGKLVNAIQNGALLGKPADTIQQNSEALTSIESQKPTVTVNDDADPNDKIEWTVVQQIGAQESGQAQNLFGTEATKTQEPSKPTFNNKQFDDDAVKEMAGVQKFEKFAKGWSGSGIVSQDSSAPSQNRKEIDNNQHSSEQKISNEKELNDKWEIKATSVEDKPPSSYDARLKKREIDPAKEQTISHSAKSFANNNNLESKVRFAPDVKDNAKDDYEDYAHAINEYERSLKKHTRETLELVDKLYDQSQRLAQQQKPTEYEKATQNPFDALPKVDSGAASNKITWNDGIFGSDSLSMDIESLRINPCLMVAPVNCLLLPSKRLVIIDNELGILLINLETKNVLKSLDAPQSVTTKWRYPQCVAFIPEKEQLLVLSECCSTAKDNNSKITPDRITTLAEVMAPKPTDFSLYICRFDAKTLQLLDRVEAPKYIRDKNVTGCHMCFAPPTSSIYLAVNTPYDAFVYKLTKECRWIEVYNRRGRNFADLQYFAVVGPITELLVLETNKQHVVMLSLYGSTVVGQRMVAVTERPGALAVDERAAVFAFDRASACVAQHSSMHFEKLRDIALVDRAQCRLSAQEHLLAVLVCPFKQIKLYKY